MFIYLTVLSLFSITHCSNLNAYQKCCDLNSVITLENCTYNCKVDGVMRLQILTNNSDQVSKSNYSGNCVDILDSHVNIFHLNEGKLSRKGNLTVKNYHPKCCPLDFYYKSDTHSCARNSTLGNKTLPHYLKGNKFVKVGLPECKIILDYTLEEEFITLSQDYNVHFWYNNDNESYDKGSFCVDRNLEGKSVVRVCKNDDYSVCDNIKCVRKCCPDGQSFVNGSHCKDTYVYGLDLKFSKVVKQPDDKFGIIHGFTGKVFLLNEMKFTYNLDPQGTFHILEEVKGETAHHPVQEQSYCIEHASKGKLFNYTFFKTTVTKDIAVKFLINRWLLIISCVFLLLTILVYIFSKEIGQLFGKILVSFCSALMFTFVIIIYTAFKPRSGELCKTLGFFLLYMIFCSFMWLNIMCLDIYWTFGSPKSMTGFQQKRKELKRFLLYTLFGWGVPLILTTIALIFYYVDVLPSALKIRVGTVNCFIVKGNYAELLFMSVPISVIEIINVVLFIKTIRYCLQVKGEIQKMNDAQNLKKKKNKFNDNKERLWLIIKLSILMGISFLFEVVSTFYEFNTNYITEYIEIVWDCFNSLQGVFIFIIFICKRTMLHKLKKNAGFSNLRRISLSSAFTRSTNLSSTRNSVGRNLTKE